MGDVLRRLERIQRKADRLLAFGQPSSLKAAPTARPTEPEFDLLGYMRARWAWHEAFREPRHLAPVLLPIERMLGPHVGQRFFWGSLPPRHWKTFSLRHVAAAHLELRPGDSVAWCSHTASFAETHSLEIRRTLKGGGVALSADVARRDEWKTAAGGTFLARGVGGEITGRGFRLIVVDDPIKSAKVARSVVERQAIFDWLENDVWTRLAPDGIGILIHTRWHPDDPIGRYRGGKGTGKWSGCNIPALAAPTENEPDPLGREIDEPLLPEWTFEYLADIRRRNLQKFSSLYQGRPVALGSKLFHEAARYSRLPAGAFAVGHGVDLAYSEKTNADWSVCVTGRRYTGSKTIYVTGVQRKQVLAPEFRLVLRGVHTRDRGRMVWRRAGTEKGTGDFLKRDIPSFVTVNASSDKIEASTEARELWNGAEIVLPAEDAPNYGDWVDDLIAEVESFTGVNDVNDDQVDALGSLVEALRTSGALDPKYDDSLPGFSL